MPNFPHLWIPQCDSTQDKFLKYSINQCLLNIESMILVEFCAFCCQGLHVSLRILIDKHPNCSNTTLFHNNDGSWLMFTK